LLVWVVVPRWVWYFCSRFAVFELHGFSAFAKTYLDAFLLMVTQMVLAEAEMINTLSLKH